MKAMHPSTRLLIDALRKVKPGEVITYDQLQAVINDNCQSGGDGYGYLATAKNWLLKNEQMHFVAERGEGIRRCDKNAIINHVLDSRRKSLNRRARKDLEITTCVEDSELTPAERVRLVAHQAIAGVVEFSTRKKSCDKLAAKAEADGQIGLQAAFEAFKAK